MGFDFIVIAPLLLSGVASPLFLDGGCIFLVGSCIVLSMVIQQLVGILVFSREEMSARPSTLPS